MICAWSNEITPACRACSVAASSANPRAVATTAAARPGARPHRVRKNADADLCPASAAPPVASRVAVSRVSCPCAWLMKLARSVIWPISAAASSVTGSRRASSASAASRGDCSGKHIFESSHPPPTKPPAAGGRREYRRPPPGRGAGRPGQRPRAAGHHPGTGGGRPHQGHVARHPAQGAGRPRQSHVAHHPAQGARQPHQRHVAATRLAREAGATPGTRDGPPPGQARSSHLERSTGLVLPPRAFLLFFLSG